MMKRSEYIIWRVETREDIQREHSDWDAVQVETYLNKVEQNLRNKGLLTVEGE